MKNNIPANAQKVRYDYGQGRKGFYWIWPVDKGLWVWEALGHGGSKPNKTMAVQAAYQWIVNNRIE